MRASTIVLLLSLAGVACSQTPRTDSNTGVPSTTASEATSGSSSTDGGDPGTSSTTTGSSSSEVSSTGADEPRLDVGFGDGGVVLEIAEVFGHSANTLYRLDPVTKEVDVVGSFSGCTNSIIDIALDAESRMYGTAFSSLWSIDRKTGQCTRIASGNYPTSLSFVPAGTVDPDEEALVGFVDDEYIRIDTTTGAVTSLGTLTGGLVSSGDMVSVIGGSSYLTVSGPGCETSDCIIEIDPVDGSVLRNFGPLTYREVFGLAFWAGRAYGFARNGTLFEIGFPPTGVSTVAIPIPNAPSNLEFYGAGSTTSAPPIEG